LHSDALAELLRPADPDGRGLRPSIKSHGDYVFGVLLAAVAVPEEDIVYYQEVDFILSRRQIAALDLVGWSWGTTTTALYTTRHGEKVQNAASSGGELRGLAVKRRVADTGIQAAGRGSNLRFEPGFGMTQVKRVDTVCCCGAAQAGDPAGQGLDLRKVPEV